MRNVLKSRKIDLVVWFCRTVNCRPASLHTTFVHERKNRYLRSTCPNSQQGSASAASG